MHAASDSDLLTYRQRLVAVLAADCVDEAELKALREFALERDLDSRDLRNLHRNVFGVAASEVGASSIELTMRSLGLTWTFVTEMWVGEDNDGAPTPGTLEELFEDWGEYTVFDWAECAGVEAEWWEEPPPSDDKEEREFAAEQIYDVVERFETSAASLEVEWIEQVAQEIGPKPKLDVGLRPIEPNLELVQEEAVRREFGGLARIAPWKTKARAASREAAKLAASAQFEHEMTKWEESVARGKVELAEWDASRVRLLASATPWSTLGRRWFLAQLERLDYPVPIRCAIQLDPVGLRIDLLLPDRAEIPATEATVLKSGRLGIRKASKQVREQRWEVACKLLGIRVAIAALNAFPSIKAIVLAGHEIQSRSAILELQVARDVLIAGGAIAFDGLQGKWNPSVANAIVKARAKEEARRERERHKPRERKPRSKKSDKPIGGIGP